jgi:hypothetical protein
MVDERPERDPLEPDRERVGAAVGSRSLEHTGQFSTKRL